MMETEEATYARNIWNEINSIISTRQEVMIKREKGEKEDNSKGIVQDTINSAHVKTYTQKTGSQGGV